MKKTITSAEYELLSDGDKVKYLRCYYTNVNMPLGTDQFYYSMKWYYADKVATIIEKVLERAKATIDIQSNPLPDTTHILTIPYEDLL